MKPVTVERLTDKAEGLRALAMLRMVVFRTWPYLYEGSHIYEEQYLRAFVGSERATLVLAQVGDIPVGMATASPLSGQPESLTAPLVAAGIDLANSFYFGESVVLPQFHGQGIGHRFFDEREAAALEAGAERAVFCAVVRDPDHPLRPVGARDLTTFWCRRGYAPLEGTTCSMDWTEIGATEQTAHLMQFWSKAL